MEHSQSRKLFTQSCAVLPGGVNSPVRAFRAVGGNPIFVKRGEGPHLYDVDGNRYVDYVMSYGPLLMGHAPPELVEKLKNASHLGTSFGAPSEKETDLARLVMRQMPGIEMIRFVNSGTEACMSVIRLARAFTRRNKIIKCEGNYHGHADALLKKAGSGVATLGLQDSPGIPLHSTEDTVVVPFNELGAVEEAIHFHKDQVAAIILEPVAGNMGVVPPEPNYLQELRELTQAHNILLIFDEVMTGFRVDPGGAQALYGVCPDLTALGKIIGGGLPVGAYGGRQEIMEMVAPQGSMYQAGTLSGNPLAMTAGIWMLESLEKAWPLANNAAKKISQSLRSLITDLGLKAQVHQVGAMFSLFFCPTPIKDYQMATQCDVERFGRVFWRLLQQGVYLPPSQYEACFTSSVHESAVVEHTLNAFAVALESEVTGIH